MREKQLYPCVPKNPLYSIGEASRMCHISTKTLRFYERIGIITPDVISESNLYRYYSYETLLRIPIIKYYKQMNFKLREMQQLLTSRCALPFVMECFQRKIGELETQEKEIHNSYMAVKEWYELIEEAHLVKQSSISDVGIKFINSRQYCCQWQSFDYHYMESIINIEWVNYLESVSNEIVGPVILNFPSYQEKRHGRCKRARIMQRAVHPLEEDTNRTVLGGGIYASLYHIGPFETLDEEYGRIEGWADKRGYTCGPECYERYVVDYWTTRDADEFITEIIVPISKKNTV